MTPSPRSGNLHRPRLGVRAIPRQSNDCAPVSRGKALNPLRQPAARRELGRIGTADDARTILRDHIGRAFSRKRAVTIGRPLAIASVITVESPLARLGIPNRWPGEQLDLGVLVGGGHARIRSAAGD